MKHARTCLICLLLAFLTACNTTPPSASKEFTSKITQIQTTLRPLSEIELTETVEWRGSCSSKQILLCSKGFYYYYDILNGESTSSAIRYYNGTGRAMEVPGLEGFVGYHSRNGAIYGRWGGLYRVKGKTITLINEMAYNPFFSEKYIYFSGEDDVGCPVIYRMDYNGKNLVQVAKLNDHKVFNFLRFAVYDGKIWYEFIDQLIPGSLQHTLASYDMKTKEVIEFDCSVGGLFYQGTVLFNNGYLYYVDRADNHKLYRLNCKTYDRELVCDTFVGSFNFFGGYILYVADGSFGGRTLYRMNENENKAILSVEQVGTGSHLEIIQCEEGRIFVKNSGGSFYMCLAEIDIDGNILRTIHEKDLLN